MTFGPELLGLEPPQLANRKKDGTQKSKNFFMQG
jgi:hypothetical protein